MMSEARPLVGPRCGHDDALREIELENKCDGKLATENLAKAWKLWGWRRRRSPHTVLISLPQPVALAAAGVGCLDSRRNWLTVCFSTLLGYPRAAVWQHTLVWFGFYIQADDGVSL